ncbi:hypothetical protein B0H19DRAFT_1056800 [Mycena capillaripes]|nr:hypothetical protein B0H19DRAFT_1056800 [Mycena capillaripes]
MYNINVNVDVAAILHLIGTALLHAYRNINVSVPATLEATEGDLADVASIVGEVRRRALLPHTRRTRKPKTRPTGVRRMATNAKFPAMFRGMKRTLTRTATRTANLLGPIIGQPSNHAPSPPTSSRSSESMLRNPCTSPEVLAADVLSSKRAAPPCSCACSCATILSQLNSTRNISALLIGLSQAIANVQGKIPPGHDTCFNPNEAALVQLVRDLIIAQAAAGSIPQAAELTLVQVLVILFTPVPSSVSPDFAAVPVAVADL